MAAAEARTGKTNEHVAMNKIADIRPGEAARPQAGRSP